MNLKRFGLALAAVAMLAAITAGSASAAASTPTETHWIVSTTKMATGGSETVSCALGKHLFGATREAKLALTGTLGATLTPVTLTATAIECISTTGGANGTATINQTATMAEDNGRLKFTGVTVDSPQHCTVKGFGADPVGTVTTLALKSQIQEETVGKVTTVFDKFEPASGTVFAEIEIASDGEEPCAVSGPYAAKGVSFGEAVKNVEGTEKAPTGFEATPQALTFSKAVEETAGGTLKLGGNPATIEGRILNTLKSGLKFGAVE